MAKKALLIGIGLDTDGHTRITRSDDYHVFGGSKETHERLQETVAKCCEEAKRRGKQINQFSPGELLDVLNKARS